MIINYKYVFRVITFNKIRKIRIYVTECLHKIMYGKAPGSGVRRANELGRNIGKSSTSSILRRHRTKHQRALSRKYFRS